MTNINEATGNPENIQLVTTELGNGDLLYVIGVAPRDEFNTYRTCSTGSSDRFRLAN